MDDLVQRLRNTPNWMRESFGSWKDCVLKYDRAPFEAADAIERLTAERDSALLAYKTSEDDVFNLTQKVIPNLRAERDALQAKLDALISGKNTT